MSERSGPQVIPLAVAFLALLMRCTPNTAHEHIQTIYAHTRCLGPPMQVQECADQCEKTKGCSVFAYSSRKSERAGLCYWQYTQKPGVCSHRVLNDNFDVYALNGWPHVILCIR